MIALEGRNSEVHLIVRARANASHGDSGWPSPPSLLESSDMRINRSQASLAAT